MEMKKLLIKAEKLNRTMVCIIDEMFDDGIDSIEMEELYNELSDEAYKEYPQFYSNHFLFLHHQF